MPIRTAFNVAALPAWLENAYHDISARSLAYTNARLRHPELEIFPAGQRYAPDTDAIASARQQLALLSEQGQPQHALAQDQAMHALTPHSAAEMVPYMNPYMGAVSDRMAELGGRNLREHIMPQLESAFVRAGQHGSGRHRQMAERAARDTQAEILARQGALLHEGYGQGANIRQQDQNRRLQGARELQNIGLGQQGARLANAEAQRSFGREEQAYAQRGRDYLAQRHEHLREQPLNLLQQHAALVNGVPAPVSNIVAAQERAPAQMNAAGSLGSLAGSLLSSRMQGQPQQQQRKRGGSILKPKLLKTPQIKIKKPTIKSVGFKNPVKNILKKGVKL